MTLGNMTKPHRTRLLIKISGESLKGDKSPLEEATITHIAYQLKQWLNQDPSHQLCLVIGGGNLWRGRYCDSIPSSTSDQMGMLATIMNGLYLNKALKNHGLNTRVYSAIPIDGIVDGFSYDKADQDLNDKKVIILTGGTGNPFFTTDSAAVLRALELGCHAVAKATKVRGVFSADPILCPEACFYPFLTHKEVIDKKLQIMDQTAFVLAQEHNLPIIVFDLMTTQSWDTILSLPNPLSNQNDVRDRHCTVIYSNTQKE